MVATFAVGHERNRARSNRRRRRASPSRSGCVSRQRDSRVAVPVAGTPFASQSSADAVSFGPGLGDAGPLYALCVKIGSRLTELAIAVNTFRLRRSSARCDRFSQNEPSGMPRILRQLLGNLIRRFRGDVRGIRALL